MTYRLPLGNVAALLLPLLAAPAQVPDRAALNAAFGIPIWSDDDLWDDGDAQIAERLMLWPESRTDTDSSYRVYAGPAERVLGARPFSVAFYGARGKAASFSMVFTNKGDLAKEDPRTHRVNDDYKKQITLDAKTIEGALAKTLGPPRNDQFGQGAKTRERVDRWDWKGHTILLAAPRGEYVAVRIIPTAEADGQQAPARTSDAEIAAQLKARVVRRPNGDVILRDIPMVDQGPKGYCVPATWERALRYMGIPADMYVLAMAAQTSAGGGTDLKSMTAAVSEIVARSGRRLVTSGGRLTPQSVARFIDEGMPILWGMFFVKDLDENITLRSVQRLGVTNWAAYKETLKPWRVAGRRVKIDPEESHMCMIIGYNAETGEIAISDSWGPGYAERWITAEEASAISFGDLTLIGM